MVFSVLFVWLYGALQKIHRYMIIQAHVYTNMTKLSQNTYYPEFKYLHTLYKVGTNCLIYQIHKPTKLFRNNNNLIKIKLSNLQNPQNT